MLEIIFIFIWFLNELYPSPGYTLKTTPIRRLGCELSHWHHSLKSQILLYRFIILPF